MKEQITTLSDLSARYHNGYSRAKHGAEEWSEGVLQMASALYEAREKFPNDDNGFSDWLTQNGMDQFGKNDRAALINMGKNLELTREVLAKTESRSLRLIWANEMQPKGVPNAGKPPKPHYREPEIETFHNQGLSNKEISEKVGVHKRVVDDTVEHIKIRQNAEAQIKLEDLNLTQQQKLALAIKQHQQKLDASFMSRVIEAISRALTAKAEEWGKEQELHKRVMQGRRGCINKKTFNLIRSCLHPDKVTDEKQKATYNEAFLAFNKLEKLLLDEKESPTTFFKIPKTRAEWEAKS